MIGNLATPLSRRWLQDRLDIKMIKQFRNIDTFIRNRLGDTGKLGIIFHHMAVILDHCSTARRIHNNRIKTARFHFIIPCQNRRPNRLMCPIGLANMMRQRTATMRLRPHNNLNSKTVENADRACVNLGIKRALRTSCQQGNALDRFLVRRKYRILATNPIKWL